MKIRVFLTVLLFGLMVTGNALAQEKLEEFMTQTTPEERARMQTDYMKQSLSLTDAQVPVVTNINLKYSKKMQAAYEGETRKFQRLRKLKQVGDEKDTELKKALDQAQYQTYLTNKEAMKEKLREKAKERRDH